MTRAVPTHATALVLILLSISTTVAHGQTPRVPVGAGSQSCGQWVTARGAIPQTETDTLGSLAVISWVQGFLAGSASSATVLPTPADGAPSPNKLLVARQTAWRTVSGWLYDPPDAPAIQVWLDQHCPDHALEPIADAAFALSEELVMKKAGR
jgi:hypothetical protein